MAYTAKTRQQLVHETIRELGDWGRPDVLAAAIVSTSALTLTATDYTLFTKYCTFEIDQELFLGPASNATSTAITNTKRGHQGTTAATHLINSMVRFNPKYPQTTIINLINTCLESELQQRKLSDATTTGAAETYLYDLPTGVTGRNLKEVYIRSSNTDATARTEDAIRRYRINEGQGGSGVDQIEFGFQVPASQYIKFVYAGGFTYLETDATSCDLPLNESAQRLPILYACSKLLPIRENPRLRRDKNTFPEGSTRPGLRERGGDWYWNEFVRVRKQLGLAPKLNAPLTVGW